MTASLGIIGGAGWLGQAIARAVVEAGLVAPGALTLSYRNTGPVGPAGAYLDYLTGLTGTGPAYFALMAVTMVEDAISRGLDSGLARHAVTALFISAGRLIGARGEDPAKTVETFMAYRGVTAAGLQAMRDAGFDRAVKAGLAAAAAKATEMGRGG